MTQVLVTTSLGNFTIELEDIKAPKTTENFLGYVREGFYDGVIFHRVIPKFMIQAGGFEPGMTEKTTRPTINHEGSLELKNLKYTLAMARTNAPHSASSQFFINTVDNGFLNYTSPGGQGWGYAVFGRVTEGTEVIDAIEKVSTGRRGGHDDVPADDVVIVSMKVVGE
ncbi:MAG: peptidylprolyl isomerase [Candidatus Gracilibacteria bacterium]|nr:peptidylprolyl isomerase [Candidatus Gracilibacteria bacterium]